MYVPLPSQRTNGQRSIIYAPCGTASLQAFTASAIYWGGLQLRSPLSLRHARSAIQHNVRRLQLVKSNGSVTWLSASHVINSRTANSELSQKSSNGWNSSPGIHQRVLRHFTTKKSRQNPMLRCQCCRLTVASLVHRVPVKSENDYHRRFWTNL